jgi:hypothetical protein
MKKITLLLMLLMVSVSFAQLKTTKVEEGVTVGKIGPLGQNQVILEKYSNNYVLAYRDMTYPAITEVKSFVLVDNEVEDLYNFIVKGFEEKSVGETIVELKQAKISVEFVKTLGIVNVKILHWVTKDGSVTGFTQYMTKKQVDKLFGKQSK